MSKIRGKIIEVTHEDLIDHLIDYYHSNDEYTYLTLRKEQMKGKTKKFKKLMDDGGGENIKKEIDRLMNAEKVVEINGELDDDVLTIDDGECELECVYNDELDMYVHTLTRTGVNADNWGTWEVIWYTYVKIEQ
jgi:hypothetical protein